jgi:hypothetical protein
MDVLSRIPVLLRPMRNVDASCPVAVETVLIAVANVV